MNSIVLEWVATTIMSSITTTSLQGVSQINLLDFLKSKCSNPQQPPATSQFSPIGVIHQTLSNMLNLATGCGYSVLRHLRSVRQMLLLLAIITWFFQNVFTSVLGSGKWPTSKVFFSVSNTLKALPLPITTRGLCRLSPCFTQSLILVAQAATLIHEVFLSSLMEKYLTSPLSDTAMNLFQLALTIRRTSSSKKECMGLTIFLSVSSGVNIIFPYLSPVTKVLLQMQNAVEFSNVWDQRQVIPSQFSMQFPRSVHTTKSFQLSLSSVQMVLCSAGPWAGLHLGLMSSSSDIDLLAVVGMREDQLLMS